MRLKLMTSTVMHCGKGQAIRPFRYAGDCCSGACLHNGEVAGGFRATCLTGPVRPMQIYPAVQVARLPKPRKAGTSAPQVTPPAD
jgi:hypothetical protein